MEPASRIATRSSVRMGTSDTPPELADAAHRAPPERADRNGSMPFPVARMRREDRLRCSRSDPAR